jgi:hypothetical protein
MAVRHRFPFALVFLLIAAWTQGEPKPASAQVSASQTSGTTGPSISALPEVIEVGDAFDISGSGFTPGSVVNFFVATASGPENFGPMIPAPILADSLKVFVPLSVIQGEGVASIEVVNTDQGHLVSNTAYAFLQGNAAAGLPSLTQVDGKGLSPSSLEPGIALANVETVIVQGKTVTLGGRGFDTSNGVAVDLFCDCPGGKVGPFYINPGSPGLGGTALSFALPSGAFGPATGPGSFRVTNLGNFSVTAAVSVPVGDRVAISGVAQTGSTVTVTGAGFCHLTVINLFNSQAGAVVNVGGLTPDGSARIPLSLINEHQFTFTLPDGVAGAAYVQALNPPFIPFTSSGNSPAGAFDAR